MLGGGKLTIEVKPRNAGKSFEAVCALVGPWLAGMILVMVPVIYGS